MKELAFICASLVASASASVQRGDQPMTWGGRAPHPAVVNTVVPQENTISLSGEWSFSVPDRDLPNRNGIWGNFSQKQVWLSARPIKVPGCWEAQGVGSPGMGEPWDPAWDHMAKPIRNKYMGEGWYRRTVDIPAAWSGRRIWLKVGGVKSIGWFWVNDRQVALVDNYCATEKYEITDLVVPGKPAKIVVDVDNRKPSRKGLMSALHRWGGIYRDIELEATPATFIDDAWVRGDFDRRCARVNVSIEGMELMKGALTARAEVEGSVSAVQPTGGGTQPFEIEVPLSNFRPWSPEHPNLYTAKVELVSAEGKVLHSRVERFGVRKLEIRGRDFYLNNRPFYVRGFGDDAVYPLTGVTPADRDCHRRHLAKARAAGFNFVRLHTHCEVPEYFEAADELGILVQAELPYYSDVPCEGFAFDPLRDVTELWRNFRRHPSFAVYSTGNEGSFGDVLDARLHTYVKQMDPDRLKICQDSNRPEINAPDRADFCGGPITFWERGTFDPVRPFVTHEYLNLCVKSDVRDEAKYTGAWLPPATRERRSAWLARFGLGKEWGDRLQDAQNSLQKVWQKRGIEAARHDPFCRGYCFWTITDVAVRNEAADAYSAQGLFNPFWEEKPNGATVTDFAMFNSASCVLVDVCPTQCVFAAGDRFRVDVSLAHYGEVPMPGAQATWRLSAGDETLVEGRRAVGTQDVGAVRKVAVFDVCVPDVVKPVKALLSVSVGSARNSWDLWLFPKGPSLGEIRRKASSAGVIIASAGSPEAKAALVAGKPLVVVGGTDGKPNVELGWWWMGPQVGTAIRQHSALGTFPHEGVLSPLLFRLAKKGRELPVPGLSSEDMIIVGEGGEKCYVYLCERRIGKSLVFECWGLDLLSGLPEGNWLLDGLVAELARKGRSRADKDDLPKNANMDFSCGLDGWTHKDKRWFAAPGKGRNRSAAAAWKGEDGKFDEQLKRTFSVEAGGVYRLGVWAKTVDLKLNGLATKPILCCGYSDKNGKYIGSFWGGEVSDNISETDGWRYYEGTTPPLPSGTAFLTVSLTFRGGAEGMVLFDDVGFERIGSEPIAYVASSRYRDEAVSGSVDFHSLLHINTVKHPLKSLCPVFRYIGADGKSKEVSPSVLKPSETSVTLDVADMVMGRQDVHLVVRTDSGELIGEASCPFTRLSKPRQPHVRFDEFGRTWVAGKKFFPLGFYSPGDSDPRRWAPYYAQLTNGVINCLLPYQEVSVETIRRFDAAGVKTIYSLREWLWGTPRCRRECRSHDASLARIREIVGGLKDEPGIIAWYVMDEAPLSQAPFLNELRGLLHGIDPDRPVYAVTDKPYDVRQFVASFDVIGMDPYPIGNHGGAKIDIASKWPVQASEEMWRSRPMWQVPQTFNWWWERKTEVNPEHRFPRRGELANMCYQAIAAGANGLIAFDLPGTTRKDKDGTTGFARTLEIYKEIKSQTDLFLSDPGPAVSATPIGTIARTWRRENGSVSALVVNTTRNPVGGVLACSGCEQGLRIDLPALGYVVMSLRETQPK